MDALVAMTTAAGLGGQAFIFSGCCSDAQHDPCQSQALGKALWYGPLGLFLRQLPGSHCIDAGPKGDQFRVCTH